MNTVQDPTDAMVASFSAPTFEVNDPWGTNTARGGLDPMDLSSILCTSFPPLPCHHHQNSMHFHTSCFSDRNNGKTERERVVSFDAVVVGSTVLAYLVEGLVSFFLPDTLIPQNNATNRFPLCCAFCFFSHVSSQL